MQSEKFKVTPLERSWILYDVGNSAFVLMIATLVPIFFNALAEAGGLSSVNYLAYWGYASSVVTVTTLEALKGMISVHRLLQASNPVKRWVVLTGMKVVGKYDMLHGLVANPQPNPKCVESGKRLEELYAQALPLAETLTLEFVAKLDTDQPLSKAFDHTFGEF